MNYNSHIKHLMHFKLLANETLSFFVLFCFVLFLFLFFVIYCASLFCVRNIASFRRKASNQWVFGARNLDKVCKSKLSRDKITFSYRPNCLMCFRGHNTSSEKTLMIQLLSLRRSSLDGTLMYAYDVRRALKIYVRK